MEDDDLELLEENTGKAYKKNRLTRLRRGRESESPPASSSKRRAVVESSDDDLDDEGGVPRVQDIQRIWDDDRGREEDEDDIDMDDFIEYDEPEEGGAAIDEAERQRMKKQQQLRKKARGARPELAGIDAK